MRKEAPFPIWFYNRLIILAFGFHLKKESLGASQLVQISQDPYVTALEARMRCAKNNIHPNL